MIEYVNHLIECVFNRMMYMVNMSSKPGPKKSAKVSPRKEGLPSPDSREVLISAAIKLFAERGFDGTTTRDIVQATGLNISLISYYFGGKEGLMGACLEHIQTKIQGQGSPNLVPADSPADFAAKLRAFIESYLRSHVDNPFMHRVVQREYERDSAVFRHMVQTRYVQWYVRLSEFIAHAQKKHWIRSNIDPMTIAIALYGAMVQQLRLNKWRSEIQGCGLGDPQHFNRVVDDIAGMFAQGLLHM